LISRRTALRTFRTREFPGDDLDYSPATIVDARAVSGSGNGIPGQRPIALKQVRDSRLCRKLIVLTFLYISYIFVIPTGAGANATAQWRNLPFLAWKLADSSRQKQSARNDDFAVGSVTVAATVVLRFIRPGVEIEDSAVLKAAITAMSYFWSVSL
jgi:hypothetical protein